MKIRIFACLDPLVGRFGDFAFGSPKKYDRYGNNEATHRKFLRTISNNHLKVSKNVQKHSVRAAEVKLLRL